MPIVLNCLPWMKTQLTSNICVRIVPNLEEIVLFVKNLVPSILIRINVESLNYRIRSSSTINLMIPNRRYSFYIVHQYIVGKRTTRSRVKQSQSELLKCNVPNCHKLYHFACVETSRNFKIMDGVTQKFKCSLHYCDKCKEPQEEG